MAHVHVITLADSLKTSDGYPLPLLARLAMQFAVIVTTVGHETAPENSCCGLMTTCCAMSASNATRLIRRPVAHSGTNHP